MPPGCFNGPERPSQPPRAEARQASPTVPPNDKTATSERWGWASSPCREIEGEGATSPAASYESGPNSTIGLP